MIWFPAALVVGGLICIYFLLKLERHLIDKRGREYERMLPSLQKTPDFSGLESLFGCEIPSEVREFYLCNPNLLRQRFKLRDTRNREFFIDHFIPAIPKIIGLIDDIPGFFPFATDGDNGLYEVCLFSDDPSKVLMVMFAKDDMLELGISFTNFVNLAVCE